MRHTQIGKGKISVATAKLSRIVKEVSGGHASITIKAHDAFAIVGMGLTIQRLYNLLARHLPLQEFKASRLEQQLISDSCLLRSLRDTLEATHSIALLKKLRAETTKPIFAVSEPNLCEASLLNPAMAHASLLVKTGAMPRLVEQYQHTLRSVVANAGGILYLRPTATEAHPGFTKEQYSRGSTRLRNQDVQHPDGDRRHMNHLYGSLVLMDLLPQIKRSCSLTI
jgi:hypothetical protein